MAATPSGKDKTINHTRIFVGGYDLSGDARSIGGLTAMAGEVEFTGWSDAVKNFLANGRYTVGIDGFQAFANDATAGAFSRLKEAGAQTDIAVLMGGGGEPACPDPAYIIPSVQMTAGSSFDSEAAVIDADFKLDAETDVGDFNNPLGYTLANWSISNTTSGDSHDNGAATTNGMTAVIQVLTTSVADYVFTIEQSSDDGAGDAWATIGTFTLDGSTIGSEFINISGAVEQYIRFVATRTSGAVDVVCAYARNN